MTPLEFSDSVVIDKGREEIYALVSDVTRMGQWSPQCRACWWDDPDAGPVVGAWFTGRNENAERTWETRSQVVQADPGSAFAWEVNNGWVRWGFTLAAGDENGTTKLTQSWVFLPAGIAGFGERYGAGSDDEIAVRSRSAVTGIPVTLAAIKATAELSR